ncbi:hypothetical protein [Paenibacillus sp. IHBB 10380]|uniref:hypothetical protein n=1 Tax=Paenibacillus sp. IHBB 10380 TaxID=1566358 RepID=UPI0006963A64|nr:hypothetical protein [Paenibacillus sp. IHBB 10380]
MLKVIVLMLGILPLVSGSPVESVLVSEVASPTINHATWNVSPTITDSMIPESLDTFDKMNGISLWDEEEDVISKKGEPLEVTYISMLDCDEYRYADSTIGICHGIVDYVHINSSAGMMEVNGQVIELSHNRIREALGEPQFNAEDGYGYSRGTSAIKVYKDPISETIEGVDFFDESAF